MKDEVFQHYHKLLNYIVCNQLDVLCDLTCDELKKCDDPEGSFQFFVSKLENLLRKDDEEKI